MKIPTLTCRDHARPDLPPYRNHGPVQRNFHFRICELMLINMQNSASDVYHNSYSSLEIQSNSHFRIYQYNIDESLLA